jgi:hypothetical protein
MCCTRRRRTCTALRWNGWPLVFFAGFAQAHPEIALPIRFETISCVFLIIAAIPVNRWMARRYQRQIDELSRLQEEH